MSRYTCLPKAKDISLEGLMSFNGSPENLSLFDTQLRNILKYLGIPVYHGGMVWGNDDSGFSYAPLYGVGVDARSNYSLGEKLCSGISLKFSGAAAYWWDDYSNDPRNAAPNCWKKATSPMLVPQGLTEVSLYDLLAEFDPAIDVKRARMELEICRAEGLAFDGGALEVFSFRRRVGRLCNRAGKPEWHFKRVLIHDILPDWLKSQVDRTASEEDFWQAVTAGIDNRNHAVRDELVSVVS